MSAKILNLIKKLLPYLVIIWAVLINLFPKGYIYTSGDFAQPVNMQNIFSDMFYVWNNRIAATGEGGFFSWFTAIPYYFVFYYLPLISGLMDSYVLSVVLFLFLLLSYLSFRVGLMLLFGKKNGYFYHIFPLVYAFNTTTLYFFTYTWGFSHQVYLYLTIPILAGVFYKLVADAQPKYTYLFPIVLLGSIPGFTNSAFFVSLALFLILFLVVLAISKLTLSPLVLIKRLVISGFLSILALSTWLLPTIYFARDGLVTITEGIFDLLAWLETQSANLASIFMGLPEYKNFFPYKYDYDSVFLFAFIPILVLLYLLTVKPITDSDKKNYKLSIALLVITIIFAVLLKKTQAPFGQATLKLYQLPLLATLRSYEKVAIFWPFLVFAPVYGMISETWFQGKKRPFMVLALVLCLLAPLPFFMGGIQKRFSITFDERNTYLTAEFSSLIRIPKDYYDTANYLNANVSPAEKIQSLPYANINTFAWVYYPKWKMIGVSAADNLFNQPIISQNASQFLTDGWNPSEDFSYKKYDPVWYTRLLSLFNVSNIIYHLDVDDKFIHQTYDKVKELEEAGVLTKIYETPLLQTFELNPSNRLESLYIPKKVVGIYGNPSSLPHVLLNSQYTPKSAFVFLKNMDDVGKYNLDTIFYTKMVSGNYANDNLTWNSNWPWPKSTNVPDSVSFRLEIYREAAAELKAFDKYSLINIKLMHAVMRASELDMLAPNLNDGLARQYKDKVSEIINTLNEIPLSDREDNFYKAVVRVKSYLLRVSEDYSQTPELEKLFSGVKKSFTEWIDTNNYCMVGAFCYKLKVPLDGIYELYIDKSYLGEIKTLVPEIYLVDAVKNKIKLTTSLIDEGYQYKLVDIPLKSSEYIFLNMLSSENKNLVPQGNWNEYQSFSTDNESVFLKPQFITNINPRYKEIENWEPGEKYRILFDYKIVEGRAVLAVIEDSKSAFEHVLSTNQNEQALQFVKNVAFKQEIKNSVDQASTGSWRHYERDFDSSRESHSAYLFLSGSTGDSFFGDIQIKNLTIRKIIKPSAVLKLKDLPIDELAIVKPEMTRVKKISPVRYEVEVVNSTEPYMLVLSETFNSGWRVYKRQGDKVVAIANNKHHKINGYSNGWVIPVDETNHGATSKLIVEFWPQKLLIIGTYLSTVSLLICSGFLFLNRKKVNHV